MIGFDIGGTKCAVVIGEEVHGTINIIKKEVLKTDLSISPYEMIDKMCEIAEILTNDFSRIGISCGGPLSSEKGIIMSPPNLPGWDNVKIVEYLKEKYNGIVNLQNDADACAYAEWKIGAGVGTKNMIFLTFGTGLGAGLILDGKLYTGTNDSAGEAGHIRLSSHGPVGYGKSGSFEGFCSGGGIAQLGEIKARELIGMGKTCSFCPSLDKLSEISAKSIAESATAGNADAIEVYNLCGEKLGYGLSILIDILNPEMIVLGSIFTRSQELLRNKIYEILEKECLPRPLSVCKIVPAKLGENLGDYAALAVALK